MFVNTRCCINVVLVFSDACLSQPERGLCADSDQVGYYYNASSHKCQPHHFSICAVGMNRFEDKETCLAVCDSIEAPVEPKKPQNSDEKTGNSQKNRLMNDDQISGAMASGSCFSGLFKGFGFRTKQKHGQV